MRKKVYAIVGLIVSFIAFISAYAIALWAICENHVLLSVSMYILGVILILVLVGILIYLKNLPK